MRAVILLSLSVPAANTEAGTSPHAIQKGLTVAARRRHLENENVREELENSATKENPDPACPECGAIFEWESNAGNGKGACNRCGSDQEPIPPHEVLDRAGLLRGSLVRKSVFVVLSKGASPNVRAAALAVAQARAQTDTVPSRAQYEAGNYRKGLVRLHGFAIKIENPKGSVRRGYDAEGNPTWQVTMGADYGYFIRRHGSDSTPYGRDGDPVDVFLGPRPDSELVFIIDQVNRDGVFDEAKCILGCCSEAEARQTYLSCYSPGWTGLGAITAMRIDEFQDWLDNADKDKPVGTLPTPIRKGLLCIVALKALTDEGREALRRKAKRQPREPKGDQGGGRFVSQIEGLRLLWDDVTGANPTRLEETFCWRNVNQAEADNAKRLTGLNIEGYRHSVVGSELRHIYQGHGPHSPKVVHQGQEPVTRESLSEMAKVVESPDSIHLERQDGKDWKPVDIGEFNDTTGNPGERRIVYTKRLSVKRELVVTFSKRWRRLLLKTFYEKRP